MPYWKAVLRHLLRIVNMISSVISFFISPSSPSYLLPLINCPFLRMIFDQCYISCIVQFKPVVSTKESRLQTATNAVTLGIDLLVVFVLVLCFTFTFVFYCCFDLLPTKYYVLVTNSMTAMNIRSSNDPLGDFANSGQYLKIYQKLNLTYTTSLSSFTADKFSQLRRGCLEVRFPFSFPSPSPLLSPLRSWS